MTKAREPTPEQPKAVLDAARQGVEAEPPAAREQVAPGGDPRESGSLPPLPAPPRLPSLRGGRAARLGLGEGHDEGQIRPTDAPPTDPERSRRYSEQLNLAHQRQRRLRSRRRRRITIAVLITVPSIAVAGWLYLEARRAEAARVASIAEKEAVVAALARAADPAAVGERRAEMSAFAERHGSEREASRVWLEYLALEELVGAGQPADVERALAAAVTAGDDDVVAFARLVMELGRDGSRDLARRLAEQPTPAGDALFELAAGVAAERAGDPGARARLERALTLEPGLVIARVFLARQALLKGDTARVRQQLSAIEVSDSNPAIGRVLRGALWQLEVGPAPVSAAARAGAVEPPREARLGPGELRHVPEALGVFPEALDAIIAARSGDQSSAVRRFQKAVRRAESAAEVEWLIARALEAGSSEAAISGAQRMVELGAPLRSVELELGARLAAGELGLAQGAARRLPDVSPYKALLLAVVAYEELDAAALSRALEGRGGELAQVPSFAAALAMPDVLLGLAVLEERRLYALAAGAVFWGDLVAVDAALDAGDLELASALAARWASGAPGPSHQVRRARLARYAGRPEEALELARAAFAAAPGRRAALEVLEALIALDQGREALRFYNEQADHFGESRNYARAAALAAAGSWGIGKQVMSKRALPPDSWPLADRLFAVHALARLVDHRAPAALRPLRAEFPKNPDLVHAIELLK